AEAGHASQVTGGLGVTGTGQHTTGLGHQREDVAGADDVLGHRIGGGSGLHGTRTVGSGNAGADALSRLDGNGELGAEARAVALYHQRQFQALAAFQTHGHADQATAVTGHEVDILGAAGLGGHDQVAFVLPVLVIHQDDYLAGADVFNQFFNSIQ